MNRAYLALLTIAGLALLWASPAVAHKPSKRVARNEALIVAEDGTRQCRGSVSSRKPLVRFLKGGKHVRVVEVTMLDGELQAFTWLVVVDHSGYVLGASNTASSTGSLCGTR